MKLIKCLIFVLLLIAASLYVWENYRKSHPEIFPTEKPEKPPHYKRKQHSPQDQSTNKPQKLLKRSLQQAVIPVNVQNHIKQRHWYDAKTGGTTSRFNRDMTMQKLNALATKTINEGSKRASKQGQNRSTHQYKFTYPIGQTSTGKQAHSLRVVTDENNKVITAFPVQ